VLTCCAFTGRQMRLRMMHAEGDALDFTLSLQRQLSLELLNGAPLLCRGVLAAHELVYGRAQLLLEH